MKPVFTLLDGTKLGKADFINYFEKKVYKTIREHHLLSDKEHIGVGVSGGKDSLTVLTLLKRLCDQNKHLTISAIAIDEGIAGYRDKSLITAQEYCDHIGVKLHTASYEQSFGLPLDKILQKIKVKPCSICGIFRRYLLNKMAKDLNCTVLATGHNLDDEAQSILMNQLRHDLRSSARLGPKTGYAQTNKFIPRIKPLYLVSEKEVTTYAFLQGILDEFTECPNVPLSFRAKVRDTLNDLEQNHPGSKLGLVKSFLELLPTLKEQYKGEPVGQCIDCGEPAAKELCNACKWAKKIQE